MPVKKTAGKRSAEHSEPRFEEGLAELEAMVERVEEGELSLEETLSAYERGVALHAQLEAILKKGEQRIRMLQIRNGEPDPEAESVPFEVKE